MASAQDSAPSTQQRIPAIKVSGEAEQEYVACLADMVRLARLNVHYPDARAIRAHIEAMSPEVHRGLYGGLQIDLRSGLPTYREWTRVQTDCALAEDQVRQLGDRDELERLARSGRDPIYGKNWLKHMYYSDLVGRRTARLGDMEVFLRKVDPETQTAYFNVVLDKLDASGLFVRFTIDLAQRSSAWKAKMVRLDEDTAKHTEEFRTLIYRFTSFDAEFTYFKLVTFGHLEVERVVKGTVGPVFFNDRPAPGALGERLKVQPPGYVANFALDMAAKDIGEDKDNDPLEDPMAASLTEDSRTEYENAREQFGYKIFKDRKFVVSPHLKDEVKAFCQDEGTNNIIRVLRTRRK